MQSADMNPNDIFIRPNEWYDTLNQVSRGLITLDFHINSFENRIEGYQRARGVGQENISKMYFEGLDTKHTDLGNSHSDLCASLSAISDVSDPRVEQLWGNLNSSRDKLRSLKAEYTQPQLPPSMPPVRFSGSSAPGVYTGRISSSHGELKLQIARPLPRINLSTHEEFYKAHRKGLQLVEELRQNVVHYKLSLEDHITGDEGYGRERAVSVWAIKAHHENLSKLAREAERSLGSLDVYLKDQHGPQYADLASAKESLNDSVRIILENDPNSLPTLTRPQVEFNLDQLHHSALRPTPSQYRQTSRNNLLPSARSLMDRVDAGSRYDLPPLTGFPSDPSQRESPLRYPMHADDSEPRHERSMPSVLEAPRNFGLPPAAPPTRLPPIWNALNGMSSQSTQDPHSTVTGLHRPPSTS